MGPGRLRRPAARHGAVNDPPVRPIRRSFAWNLVGNSLYSLSQWVLLVVLARAADTAEVGRFALLLASRHRPS